MEKYDQLEGSSLKQTSMRCFTGWVLLAQLLGLTSVILVAAWLGKFHGGFAWQEDPGRQFNYHPLFMVLGLIFLYSDALLVYRVFRNERKRTIKILHAAIHACVGIFAGVGLKAVFDSHNLRDPPAPNLYSLHSWIGLTVVILFFVQWLAGFLVLLKPGLSSERRSEYMPIHTFWGVALLVLATAACLTGITEKTLWSLPNYSGFVAEGILVNCLGLCLIGLVCTVSYILVNPGYKRQRLPEEELELTR